MRKIYQLHTSTQKEHPHSLQLHAKVAATSILRLKRYVTECLEEGEAFLVYWRYEDGWTYAQTYIATEDVYIWYVITRLTVLEEGD